MKCSITECYRQAESGALLCDHHHQKFSHAPAALRYSCRWCLTTLRDPAPEDDAFCSDPCRQSHIQNTAFKPGDLGYIPRTDAEKTKHIRKLKRKNFGSHTHTVTPDD